MKRLYKFFINLTYFNWIKSNRKLIAKNKQLREELKDLEAIEQYYKSL